MSTKHNGKWNRNQRSTPRSISSAQVRTPQPRPRPVAPRPEPRPRISGQYVGVGQRPQRHGPSAGVVDVAEVRSLELVSEPVATPPTPTRTGATPRRLSVSTLILLVVVGLEIAAIAVLAFHLAAPPQDQGATVSFRSYAAPVPVPVGTTYVRSRVVSPEDLRVTHWFHTGGDVSRLTIRLPHVPGLAPGAVTVSDLLIASDGQQATTPPLAGHGPGQTYVVPAGRHIYVSYLLHGALDRSSTVAGRVLARFTALDVATPQQPVDRASYTVLGGRVLAMACSPDRPHALPRPCGGPAGGAWRAVLGRGHTDDRVMAQLDLS